MQPSGEQKPGLSDRRGIAALAAILAVGLLLRVIYLFSVMHAPDFASPVLDPQLNDYWARALVTGNWSPPAHADDPKIQTTPYGRPPGYPYFLAAVYRVLGLGYGAPRVVQTLLGLANLLLLYLLGKAWFGRGAGLSASALGAVFWSFIYFEGELNSPVLEVFLYLAMAGALWKGFTSRRRDWLLLAGVLLGLHALVRPNVLLPGVLAAAWLVWAAWNGKAPLKQGVAHALAFLLAAVVVISPALVRNWRVAHEFVLVSYYGGVNAYIGNNPRSTGDSPKIKDLNDIAGCREWNCFNYPQLERGLAAKQNLPDASFSTVSHWFYRRALDFWTGDPLAALWLTARKAALFWGPAEVSDSKVVSIEREHSPLLRRLPGFPLLFALALLWVVMALARRGGPTAPGKPRFGMRDSLALFAAMMVMLAGVPAAVMVALMWAIIARAWLRGADEVGTEAVSSPPLKTGGTEVLDSPLRGVPRSSGGCMLLTRPDPPPALRSIRLRQEASAGQARPDDGRDKSRGWALTRRSTPPGPSGLPPSMGDLGQVHGQVLAEYIPKPTFVPAILNGGPGKAGGLFVVKCIPSRLMSLVSLKGAFAGCCPGFHHPQAAALALTLVLGHFLSVLPFFIAGRYRLPVTPFLILLGGAALAQLARWAVTPGHRRHALIGTVSGIALYGAACTPLVPYTPSIATWHYHRGIALADAGNPDAAAAEFQDAVREDQNNGSAWLRLGFAYAAAGKAQDALDAYTNAVIVAPENALAHNNLGWELKKAGQTDNARQEFGAALAADPGLEIAAVNLGSLLAEAGERGKAIAVYEALLNKNPEAEQAIKNLAALKATPVGQ